LSKEASIDDLKSSYRKLVLKYHPDKWISASKVDQEKAKQQFIQIQEAYDKIKEHKGIK
jgi:DnaJ like chaperone protein